MARTGSSRTFQHTDGRGGVAEGLKQRRCGRGKCWVNYGTLGTREDSPPSSPAFAPSGRPQRGWSRTEQEEGPERRPTAVGGICLQVARTRLRETTSSSLSSDLPDVSELLGVSTVSPHEVTAGAAGRAPAAPPAGTTSVTFPACRSPPRFLPQVPPRRARPTSFLRRGPAALVSGSSLALRTCLCPPEVLAFTRSLTHPTRA